MALDIPTELLRTLVAVADAGTLRGASERIHRTPSAVSLQMARLEKMLGVPLFQKRGRTLAPTASGWAMVGHARDILDRLDAAVRAITGAAQAGQARLGMVQDLADPLLAGILRRMRLCHPDTLLEVTVAHSAALRAAVAAGDLDLALCARSDGGPREVRREDMAWIGDPEVAALDPLPLVLVEAPCPFSEAAEAALALAGKRCRIAFRSPSLPGVRAAIEAGLGIGCRTRTFAAGRLPVLGDESGLPRLPRMAYALYRGRSPTPAATALGELVEAAVAAMPPG